MTRYVAVVGPGESASGADVDAAREVGRLLAAAGAIVLTGGLGGVMAAATEGANSAGGTTVALLPGDDRSASSATVVIPTGHGELRNGLLVRAADAVIAVGGSWGTLSEIALAMRNGVPVVGLGGWDADAVIAVGGSWGTLSEIALAMRNGVPVVCLGGWDVRDPSGAAIELRRVESPADAAAAVL